MSDKYIKISQQPEVRNESPDLAIMTTAGGLPMIGGEMMVELAMG